MRRLARLSVAAAIVASSSTALAAAEPTASISMSPTGWAVSLGTLVVIGGAVWAFRKIT